MVGMVDLAAVRSKIWVDLYDLFIYLVVPVVHSRMGPILCLLPIAAIAIYPSLFHFMGVF